MNSPAKRMFCLDISRQSGKDFLMSVMAVEHCIRNKRPLRIPYGCPTAETVHRLMAPTMFAIFADCPPDLLPKEIANGTFRNSRPELNWPWGANIVLVGCDLHPAWLRGPASEVWMLTEAGFIDALDELVQSILLPQQLTLPGGWSVMASTPPDTPGHAWTNKYIPQAQEAGMYAKRTIWQCPRFDREAVQGFIEAGGGMKSTKVRREYFCEHIVESERAVVPEYADVKDTVVTADYSPPAYRDTYVAIDPGFSHATGAVFAYYDFERDKVVIEGDFAVRGLNSREVARHIKAREWQLWGRAPQKPKAMTDESWEEEKTLMKGLFYRDLPIANPPVAWRNNTLTSNTYMRVSDTDSRLIADMSVEHGLLISPTCKDEAIAALNAFRIKLAAGKYIIHPRCVALQTHLSQAIWNKSRTKYEESADGGHYDCVPAIVYLNRNVVWGRNPQPPVRHSTSTHYVPPEGRETGTHRTIAGIFGMGRKRA